MKKVIAALAALMMLLAVTGALADQEVSEEVKMFSSMWVDDFMSIRAVSLGDQWQVSVKTWGGTVSWEYVCLYDGEQKALRTDPEEQNMKIISTVDDTGSVVDSTVMYSDGVASFSLDEQGHLIWKDEKEDVGAGHAFEKIGWFEGTWDASNENGDYMLNCFWDMAETDEGEVVGGYKVEIERHADETYTHWYYSCGYDVETDTLSAAFSIKEFAEKADEPAEEVYSLVPEEGEETTTFFIDDEGCIIWKDAVENAGEGLQFLPSNG